MGSYWAREGNHQRTYDLLRERLVPASGPCDTVEGEMLRAVGKLYYEAFNNGWGNNMSGSFHFLRARGVLDAEMVEHLAENANIDRGGHVDEALMDRMVDAVVVRVRDTKVHTPNAFDSSAATERDGYAPDREEEDLDDEEDDDPDDALGLAASRRAASGR